RIRASPRRAGVYARSRTSSHQPRSSARRFARALSRLTYAIATRMFTVAASKPTYAPEPTPVGGRPFGPNVIAPDSLVPPGVTVPSFHVPVRLNGWSNTAVKYSV